MRNSSRLAPHGRAVDFYPTLMGLVMVTVAARVCVHVAQWRLDKMA